jgi:hypothetical protein
LRKQIPRTDAKYSVEQQLADRKSEVAISNCLLYYQFLTTIPPQIAPLTAWEKGWNTAATVSQHKQIKRLAKVMLNEIKDGPKAQAA